MTAIATRGASSSLTPIRSLEDIPTALGHAYNRHAWPMDQDQDQDQDHLSLCLRKVPRRFKPHVLSDYVGRYVAQGRRAANLHALDLGERLHGIRYSLAADDEDLRAEARSPAAACSRTMALGSVEAGERYCRALGLEPPQRGDKSYQVSEAGAKARLGEEQWWRRKLRARPWPGRRRLGSNAEPGRHPQGNLRQ